MMVTTDDIVDTIAEIYAGSRIGSVDVESIRVNTEMVTENFWIYSDKYRGTMIMVSASQELAFLDPRLKHFKLERCEKRTYRVDGGGKVNLFCYLRHPMPGDVLEPQFVYTPSGEYAYVNISMKPARIPEAVVNELLHVNGIEKVVR